MRKTIILLSKKIQKEKREKTFSKYGRRIDPKGVMWEEPNVEYI